VPADRGLETHSLNESNLKYSLTSKNSDFVKPGSVSRQDSSAVPGEGISRVLCGSWQWPVAKCEHDQWPVARCEHDQWPVATCEHDQWPVARCEHDQWPVARCEHDQWPVREMLTRPVASAEM
jgi:hypothetical protein